MYPIELLLGVQCKWHVRGLEGMYEEVVHHSERVYGVAESDMVVLDTHVQAIVDHVPHR